jgi:hypothetical protein
MTSGYIRFYKVETDNDCYEIAQDAGVTLKDLYSWNPALNGGFSGLQAKNTFVLGRLAMQQPSPLAHRSLSRQLLPR